MRGLPRNGVRYVFPGDALGGRPRDPSLYTSDGRVRYDLIAASHVFREGVSRPINGARSGQRIAVMCAEEAPEDCHRRLLVTRALKERGIGVQHILGDGSLVSESELRRRDPEGNPQLLLIPPEPEVAWTSTRSVLPKRAPNSSSVSSAPAGSAGS